MTVDIKGNLYITAGDPSGIIVYTPVGNEIAFIPTPFGPRNVTFEEAHRIGLYTLQLELAFIRSNSILRVIILANSMIKN